jgi:hypothetical protein
LGNGLPGTGESAGSPSSTGRSASRIVSVRPAELNTISMLIVGRSLVCGIVLR